VDSEDGFRWTQPQRCAIDVPGLRDFDGVTFFIDPAAPETARYKLVYCASFPKDMYREEFEEYVRRPERYRDTRISPERRHGLFAAAAPDGVRWAAMPGLLFLHSSDTDIRGLAGVRSASETRDTERRPETSGTPSEGRATVIRSSGVS